MGVSLERVQFKFASIIGELCSEPVVLSQFAVWLDLRLAEYKSKGAISLDCSGEKPDPSWLKGLRIPAPMAAGGAKRVMGSRLAPRSTGFSRGGMYSRSSAFHRRNLNSQTNKSHNIQDSSQHELSDRLSSSENVDNMLGTGSQENSDDVVVKDEPEVTAVYPISLHQHSSSDMESRKRSAADSLSEDHKVDSSPYKISKTPNEDSSLNQSLMSVLGTSIDELSGDVSTVGDESLQNQMDYSVNLQDQKGDSTGYEWGNNSADYSHNVNVSSSSTYSANQPSTSSSTLTSNTGSVEGFADSEHSSHNVNDGVHPVLQEGKKPAVWAKLWARVGLRSPSSSLPTLLSKPSPSSKVTRLPSASTSSNSPGVSSKMSADNLRRRERIKVNNRPRTTVNYMIAAVGTFERWLWAVSDIERREIYEIPPEELDPILVDFFAMIKKPCGGQYNPESFISLRSRLDSYLKDNDYPCSITKSDLFCKSQLSFKMRKQELKEAHAESLQ